jgi:hypothetical protein
MVRMVAPSGIRTCAAISSPAIAALFLSAEELKSMADRPQFTGSKAGIPAARVIARGGQGGGVDMPSGILGAPLHRTPTTPHGPVVGAFATDISPTVRAALGKLTPSLAAGVRSVVARKRW